MCISCVYIYICICIIYYYTYSSKVWGTGNQWAMQGKIGRQDWGLTSSRSTSKLQATQHVSIESELDQSFILDHNIPILNYVYDVCVTSMRMESSRWTRLASTSHCILQSSYFNWTYLASEETATWHLEGSCDGGCYTSQLRGQPRLTSSSPVSALWSCTSRCHQLTSSHRHCRTRHLACKGRRSWPKYFIFCVARTRRSHRSKKQFSLGSSALTFSLCSSRGLGTRCNSLAHWKGWWADAWRRTRSHLPPLGGRGKPNPSP